MKYTDPGVYSMISQEMSDPIIGWRTCSLSGYDFALYESDRVFYDKITVRVGDDDFGYDFPHLCPEERERRRLVWRNERKLYKRICDSSGQTIISIYSPTYEGKVYSASSWWSDSWSGVDYGRDFDFSKSFNEQFGVLLRDVPHLALYTLDNENSPYTHGVTAMKDSYLCFNCDVGEASYYCSLSNHITNCVDSDLLYDCDQCYESINCKNCYSCLYCVDCENCAHCIGCIGLQNKKYHIHNQPVSPEEYESYVRAGHANAHDAVVRSACHHSHNEGVYGEYVHHSHNSYFVYESSKLENCKYCLYVYDSRDCQDLSVYGDGSSLVYNAAMVGPGCYHVTHSAAIWSESRDVHYSFLMVNCSHCFGCVGLKHKQYCIFNQQHTKEEYELLLPKIIEHMKKTGEWGVFFDPMICPWGHNESMSHTYSMIDKATALGLGYRRSDYEAPAPHADKIIPAEKLPADIAVIPDDITNRILRCSVSGKPYRIIPQELAFYRKHGLPIPTKHPDVRHEERMKIRSGRTLHVRSCDKTGEQMISIYSDDVPFPVWNQTSYKKEFYG